MKKGLKWINVFVALLLVFTVSVSLGCSKKAEEAPVTTEQAAPPEAMPAPEAAPAPAPEAPK